MSSPVRSATVLLVRALTYLMGALTSVLVARMLGSHERGVWAVALLTSGLVALCSELGLGMAVFSLSRRDPERRRALATVGWVLAGTSGLLASGLAVLGVVRGALPLVAGIPGDVLALALAGVVLTNLLSVGRQVLLEDGDLLGGSLSQLVQASALFAFLVMLFLAGASTRGAVALFLGSLLIAVVFTARRLRGRGLGSPSWDGKLVAPLLSTGLVVHLGTLALFLTFRFDLLLVNRFLGPTAAGLYSVSLSLSEILRGLPEVGQMLVFARSSSADLLTIVRETTKLTVLATTLAGGAACLLAYGLIPLLFGAEFAGAVTPFVALVPGMIGLAISYCVSPLLVVQGHTRVSTVASLVSLVSMVTIDLVVIPRWGLVGAAVVSSLVYWLAALVQLRWVRKIYSLTLWQLLPRRSDLRRLAQALKNPRSLVGR